MSNVKVPAFKIGSVPIERVEKVKYPGHIICEDMSDDADIARQNQSLYAQGNMLIMKLHMCTAGIKLKLCESHCTPMYCAQLWWNYKKETMRRFVVSYHNILKRVIGLSKYDVYIFLGFNHVTLLSGA